MPTSCSSERPVQGLVDDWITTQCMQGARRLPLQVTSQVAAHLHCGAGHSRAGVLARFPIF